MAESLHKDADAAKWRAALANLDPFDIDAATGSLTFARGFPFNESHRHFSHAMAIHPLGLMSVEGGGDQPATVRATIDQIEKMGTQLWCGYSFSWFSVMCARAGMADKALDYLKRYERGFIGPNGFHLNGDQSGTGLSGFTYRPFTLEGNFLAMQAVQEMLLQSWGEVGSSGSSIIRIFPAVSAEWKDVSFQDLRAEGGLRISAVRKNGTTTQIRIVANRDATVRLRDPFPGREAVWKAVHPQKAGDLYHFALTKGQVVEASVE
jgi:alpha-L-fucosidase 2